MRIKIYLNLKNYLKRFKILKILNFIVKDKIDLIFSYFICLLIYVSPNCAGFFLAEENRGIPKKKNRILRKKSVFDDWKYKYNGETIFDEINIIVRGLANYESIENCEIPSFFINFYSIPKNLFVETYGVTSDRNEFIGMHSAGVDSIIFTGQFDDKEKNKFIEIKNINDEKLNSKLKNFAKKSSVKLKCDQDLSAGSANSAIFALNKISKKINIYGWNNYLIQNINELSTLEALFALCLRPKYLNMLNLEINRTPRYKFISPSIFNFHYSYMLHFEKHIKIHGNLSGIYKHHKIIKKIQNLIYV